jgi:starch synthase (maltosyl-transferring)
MNQHIHIESVTPLLDCGRYPVKRIVGDVLVVEADVFRDGHQALRAVVKWRRSQDRAYAEAPMEPLVNDRWRGSFPLEENTRYVYTVEAWTDGYGSWLADLRKRADALMESPSEVAEGLALLRSLLARARGQDRRVLQGASAGLEAATHQVGAAVAVASEEALLAVVRRLAPREDAGSFAPELEVVVDRPQAVFSAWYEMFPRSQGRVPGKAATLRQAEWRLAEIRDMGFDVVYLPPIHPIGETYRKGKNNALAAEPGDPGSPWAIGSRAGGHTAVEPALGTLADFDRFVETAGSLGMEVALDFAIQASPDHPWVREHPEWFHHRPDGTIKYAENPPKKYQDIYPINFDTPEPQPLWEAWRDVVRFWMEHGVRIFRVDNPHTKPFVFWEWLIGSVQREHPDVIFLAEAFTRPKVMKALAKLGFTQSYTYFTWRNAKWELTEYLTELAQGEMAEFFRPNFFANTPDILHEVLQKGGAPAFRLRLVLAATLSPAYGIYSGFELCENEAVAGSEEYLNSEKYEIKARDWNQPGNLKELISRVNLIRRENPALQTLTNLRFLPADNEQILFYAKVAPERDNVLLVALNLDPFNAQACTVHVPPEVSGVAPGGRYQVVDLLTGARYPWGEHNYVRLAPGEAPAHILRVEKRSP